MKHLILSICLLCDILVATATNNYNRYDIQDTPIGFGAKGTYGVPVCNNDGTFSAPDGWTLVTCSTLSEINTALGGSDANLHKIIMVNAGSYGELSLSKNYQYVSIIGKGGVYFDKISISKGNNILVRNITFQNFSNDGFPITAGSCNIWVDHCTIGLLTTSTDKELPDGAMDITGNGNLYLTISWCKFRNHWKTMLHGGNDSDASTDDRFITHYCNYYYNTHQRTPRIRGGKTHVLNCLYENTGFHRVGNMTSQEHTMSDQMVYKDDGEYLKNRLVVSDGYGIMATKNSDVVVDSCFFFDVRWPIVCSLADCQSFRDKYGDLQSPDINNGCVSGKGPNGGVTHCRQTGNGYFDKGLPDTIRVKDDTVSSSSCGTMVVPLDYSYTDNHGETQYVINPSALNPGKRSIKFDEFDGENAFQPSDYNYYYPSWYESMPNTEVYETVSKYAGADSYSMDCSAAAPTLVLTSGSKDQTNVTTISSTVFTYGGGASGVVVSGLPNSNFSINTSTKTVTLSGTLAATANYCIKTLGGSGEPVEIVGTLSKTSTTYSVLDYTGDICGTTATLTTTIGSNGTYTLAVYNGESLVRNVWSGTLTAGRNSVTFNTTSLSSGSYTLKLLDSGSSVVASQPLVVE